MRLYLSFGEGLGVRLYLSFGGQGVRLLFIPVYRPAVKVLAQHIIKKDGDAIVQLAYVIASTSFLFKLEA